MRRGLGGLFALMMTCCSRDQTFLVDGAWLRGGISGDHFGVVVMLLRQEGDEIAGSACFTNAGHLILRDLPVMGRYPSMTLVWNGGHYTGRIVSNDTIDGLWEVNGLQQPWMFRRATLSEYEQCRNAGPYQP